MEEELKKYDLSMWTEEDLSCLKDLLRDYENGLKHLGDDDYIVPQFLLKEFIEKDKRQTISFLERMDRKYKNQEFVKKNIKNKENLEKVLNVVRGIDYPPKKYLENGHIEAANLLNELEEYTILNHYKLKPYIGKPLRQGMSVFDKFSREEWLQIMRGEKKGP